MNHRDSESAEKRKDLATENTENTDKKEDFNTKSTKKNTKDTKKKNEPPITPRNTDNVVLFTFS